QTIVVQETEYTGAGKHPMPQLTFARENGIEILFGNPDNDVPGKNIILPNSPSDIKLRDIDLDKVRASYIRNCINNNKVTEITKEDFDFLIKETKSDSKFVDSILAELSVKIK
ncbi:MAG: PLP-dependent lyase/thiolase, partial [Clostridiaceae bacterium]|nr:PLP-dependent lyase/thiolase [Clostridiaceae bacterium]